MAMKLVTKYVAKRISWMGMLLVMVSGCQNIPQSRLSAPPKAVTTVPDGDDDHDGVLNSIDQCPNTPKDTVVDSKGCTVPPTCLDCDLPNYTRRMFFNRNENYPTGNVLYEYSTGKAYFNNTEQMEIMVENFKKIIKNYPKDSTKLCIYIEGHNSKGVNGDDSDKLSEERVNIVKQIFKEKYGIAESSIYTVAYGSQRPIASPTDPEKKYMNQRVFMDLKSCG